MLRLMTLVSLLSTLVAADVITLDEYHQRRQEILEEDLLSYQRDEKLLGLQADTVLVEVAVVDIGFTPPQTYRLQVRNDELELVWYVDFEGQREEFVRGLEVGDQLMFRVSFGEIAYSTTFLYSKDLLTGEQVEYFVKKLDPNPEPSVDLEAIEAHLKKRAKSWLKDRKRLPCGDCDADGVITCSKCKGTGRNKVIGLQGGSGYKTCTKCDGARGFQCRDCDGTGLDSDDVEDFLREWGNVGGPLISYKSGSVGIELNGKGTRAEVAYNAKFLGDDEYRDYESVWVFSAHDEEWLPVSDE